MSPGRALGRPAPRRRSLATRRRASSPRRPSPVKGPRSIDEFCIPDVATMLGLTCDAVGSYLTDVIELRYRLPHLWAGVLAGQVTPWRARAIAQATVALTPDAAAFVDEQTAWCANRLTPSQLIRLVDHARARYMPDQLAQEIADAADRRHVTFSTDQVSYDGTIHLEADLEIPDALGLAEAVTAGAARLAALGSDRHPRRTPRHRPRRPRPPPARLRVRRPTTSPTPRWSRCERSRSRRNPSPRPPRSCCTPTSPPTPSHHHDRAAASASA